MKPVIKEGWIERFDKEFLGSDKSDMKGENGWQITQNHARYVWNIKQFITQETTEDKRVELDYGRLEQLCSEYPLIKVPSEEQTEMTITLEKWEEMLQAICSTFKPPAVGVEDMEKVINIQFGGSDTMLLVQYGSTVKNLAQALTQKLGKK